MSLFPDEKFDLIILRVRIFVSINLLRDYIMETYILWCGVVSGIYYSGFLIYKLILFIKNSNTLIIRKKITSKLFALFICIILAITWNLPNIMMLFSGMIDSLLGTSSVFMPVYMEGSETGWRYFYALTLFPVPNAFWLTRYNPIYTEDMVLEYVELFSEDNALLLPTDFCVRLAASSVDTIRTWSVPGLGVELIGIPGEHHFTYINIEKPGVHFGQCTGLCGQTHCSGPIKVRVISMEDFVIRWKAAKLAKPNLKIFYL